MDLNSLISWNGSPPEYILEGLWYLQVEDDELDTKSKLPVSSFASSFQSSSATLLGTALSELGARLNGTTSTYLQDSIMTTYTDGQDFLDPYISEISIPQLSIDYDKTDYDLINFKGRDAFDNVTLTFYDNAQGMCLAFFDSWLDLIFDRKKNCLRNDWRNEAKIFRAKLIRIYRQADDPVDEFTRASIGTAVTVAEGVAGWLGESLGERNKNIVVQDVAEFYMGGSYPKGIKEINLGEGGGDRQTFSVELVVEDIIPHFRARGRDLTYLREYKSN